jgi:hypothetical protein
LGLGESSVSAKLVVAALAFIAPLALAPAHAKGRARGVSGAALAAAARKATLQSIDYDEVHCQNGRTVDAWLHALAGRKAKSIDWSGGPCDAANGLSPLDAGSPWCAQATIRLAHPRDARDQPMIELYFDEPRRGRPGRAYAFRGLIQTRSGGWDLTRMRHDFETEWVDRFGPSPGACRDG